MADTPWQTRAHQDVADARRRIMAALLRDGEEQQDGSDPDFVPESIKLARKLAGCCRHPTLGADAESGQIVIGTDSCRSRLCPRCSRHRGRELRDAVRNAAMQLDAPAFLTLTLASSDEPLREQIDRLTACARRLRQRRSWRSHIAGGIQVIEVTWSSKRNRWHPHLHVLCDALYWPQSELASEWEAVTGDSRIVDIRRISSRTEAANYTAKYCSKGIDQAKLPDRCIPEWAAAMHGRRMAQTFGHLHGTRTTTQEREAKRSIEWYGWLGELWRARDDGEAEADRLLRQAMLAAQGGGDRHPAELAEELAEWFARRPLRSDDLPETSRRSGGTDAQSPQASLYHDASDPPPPTTTGPPQ